MSVATSYEEPILMTAAGYEERTRELELMRSEARRELGERLRQARQDGDLADNPALHDLLEERVQLERRIALLQGQLAVAEVVEPATGGRAGIGTIVRVRDEEGETFRYELVGALEADAENGRVSISAPVGRALLGSGAGERVEVATPRGPLALEVVSVRAGQAPARRAA
ncbi:MAG TPA: GreA/GreB family elongation factor [Gaiellaceae bacterium]|nr:GreA/GreB family elongation factor [Gaiellaceae bacterium]